MVKEWELFKATFRLPLGAPASVGLSSFGGFQPAWRAWQLRAPLEYIQPVHSE